MSRLALYLLGPPRVELDGEELHIGRRNIVALLAYLAVTGRPHRRDYLATLLWPEHDQSRALAYLRRILSMLNKALGGEWLAVDRETAGLNPDAAPWLDVEVFRQRLAACETHGHPAAEACPDCVPLLEDATALYRDDFLAGFTLRDSANFDEWQFFQTEGLRQELAAALERLVRWHGDQGEHEPAIAYARRWLTLDPLHEAAHQHLMELYAQAGQRSAALRQYRTCMRTLEEELGLPPSDDTTALYERIRAERGRPPEAEVAVSTPPPTLAPLPAFLRPAQDTILDDEAEQVVAERPVFVARERELAQLDRHLQETLAGHGRVVFITGGPGRGKTALMHEFARRALDDHPDLLVATGNCNAYSGVGDPFLPFRQVLAMLTGDVEMHWASGAISREHARRLWEVLSLTVQTLFDHDPRLIDVFLSGPGLLSRASAAASGRPTWLVRLQEWTQRERGEGADLRQHYLFEQYTNVLCALASEHPLLLALDDLQWADAPSISLMFHLGRRLAQAGARVLVLGAYRPEEVALGRRSTSSGQTEQHPLGPVLSELKHRFGDVWLDLVQADQEAGRRFVDAFLDTEPNRLGEDFRAALRGRTGGHPLFTVELLRAMQEQGDLVQDPGADGAWVEGPALDWEQVPARMEAVIEARLNRLDDELGEILQVASVEGERFTAQVIAQVQGIPEREILRALSNELAARHRLVRDAGEDQVDGRFLSGFQFVHALFQTYVYSRLSPGERRLLHGEVGAALEALYGDQSASIAVPLAHHYTQAGEREKAAEYLVHAGDQARLTHAFEGAEEHYQCALELLSSLSPTERAKTTRSRLLALKGLGLVHFASRQVAVAEEYLRQAITIGREINMPPRELVRIYFWLGEAVFWQGRADERLQIAEEGLALLADEAPSSDGGAFAEFVDSAEALESVEAALMYQLIAGTHWWKGDLERFQELADRMAGFVPRLPYTEELRPAYENIVMAHWRDKDPGEEIKWLRIFEEQAAEHYDLTALESVYAQMGFHLALRGDLPGGILKLEQASSMCAKIGEARVESLDCELIGGSFLILGDLENAELYGRRALEIAEATDLKLVQARAYWELGRIALCQGALEEAVEACQTALELSRQTGERWKEWWAICTLGRAHLAQGEDEEALRRFREAIAVSNHEHVYYYPLTPPAVLSGLEEAYSDPEAFRAFCRRFRQTHPEASDLPTVQWFLEPAAVGAVREPPLRRDEFVESLPSDWVWQDPFDDCSFTVRNGLEIHAANGRDLWSINLSAPRLLRKAPENTDWAVQTICSAASADKPAIGGLLLWKDQENYLRLDWGTADKHEIALGGCLDNQDLIIGRGRLSMDTSSQVFLRLERIPGRVDALCSADGQQWFTVGHVDSPIEDPVQIGLHAIGNIDRTIYHGAYPDGTAIRFESFTVCELDR